MSSAVVSTSAALGRPFLFDDDAEPEVRSLSSASKACPEPVERGDPNQGNPDQRNSTVWQRKIQSTIKNQHSTISLAPASQLGIRPAPEMASSGISALDALTGGLPRGCLTEICGSASSGRTTVLLAALAAATRRGEYCALLDASDALDPHSVEAARVDLDRFLWIRCGEDSPQRHRDTEKNFSGELRINAVAPPLSRTLRQGGEFDLPSQSPALDFQRGKIDSQEKLLRSARSSEHRLEQVLRATDLLLESGGFGLIVLDLADLPAESARRIPLTTWFRFRRAVEHKPTVLLAIEQQPIAGSCSSLRLQLGVPGTQYPVPSSKPSHSNLLTELQIRTELVHSRLDRKPSRSISFESKTAWAG